MCSWPSVSAPVTKAERLQKCQAQIGTALALSSELFYFYFRHCFYYFYFSYRLCTTGCVLPSLPVLQLANPVPYR